MIRTPGRRSGALDPRSRISRGETEMDDRELKDEELERYPLYELLLNDMSRTPWLKRGASLPGFW